jgi:hypothetical protein
MSGRNRLPGGEQRKASQRLSRRAAHIPTVVQPTWQPGAKVRWREYTGFYLREAGEAEAEIMVGQRRYRVAKADLRPA